MHHHLHGHEPSYSALSASVEKDHVRSRSPNLPRRRSRFPSIFSLSQRLVLELATEMAKYVLPKQFEPHTLEEALMSVPDLETVKFRVLSSRDQYEIREIENTSKEKMEMTAPVFTRKSQSDGVKMEMTTPVITKKLEDQDKWKMSFVIPLKYGANSPLPKEPSVRIVEVPRKLVAVVAFSGFITDEEVKQRESKLREALSSDGKFQVKEGTSVEVAQYNPPFTLPFQRRNEISLEVESREEWWSLGNNLQCCPLLAIHSSVKKLKASVGYLDSCLIKYHYVMLYGM